MHSASEDVVKKLLLLGKTSTIGSIYARIAPASDGAVHSDQSPYGTETTRFSHAETFLFNPGSTNLANLPKRTAALDSLYVVRDCIIAHPGRVMMKADYSAAEARWCAYIAGDSKRIQLYEQDVDQYKLFVSVLNFGVEDRTEEVSKAERNAIGKVGILSGQYGVSWKKLMDTINAQADLTGIAIDAKTAKRMCGIWPELFPETLNWHQEVREEVLTKGFLVNPFGFKRLFLARRDSPAAEEALVREAIAFGPQSANAWLLNLSLRELYYTYDPSLLRVLLQVHDELVFDCAPDDEEETVQTVKKTMEKEITLKEKTFVIPVEIERCEKNWAQSKRVA